jgi:hypothetical protein
MPVCVLPAAALAVVGASSANAHSAVASSAVIRRIEALTTPSIPAQLRAGGAGSALSADHQYGFRMDSEALRDVAATYADTIIKTIGQEYPNHLRHLMSGPDDRPTPREIHPAFYGCFDWHSAVEMHWALVRLVRLVPEQVPVDEARSVLARHLSTAALSREDEYFRAHPGFERPYGWGWLLTLADELSTWNDPQAREWSANLAPLADTIAHGFVRWLPRTTYPVREGMHANSAFALSRALPFARARAAHGDTALVAAIGRTARRWFAHDTDYPATWEPSGADFLSATLGEAVLMSQVQTQDEFLAWFERFLPGLGDGDPASLHTPAVVIDPTDGQGAHLHGLNLHRAHAWLVLAEQLPAGDPRAAAWRACAARHAAASLPAVSGSDYMVEHWLAAYAVLLLG